MTRIELLTKSAAKLNELARDIKECNTVAGEWVLKDDSDRAAKADHDECTSLAVGLLVLARST